ncbi:MAG: DinB family protein [Isosphaeraceae bacterium]
MDALRQHTINLHTGELAHLDFDRAVFDMPTPLRGLRPHGVSHSAWELVEHMRICQWDILRFTVDPAHVSPGFPEGYWPRSEAPLDPEDWDRSLDAFRADRKALLDLVADPNTDLLAPLPHAPEYTVLREALLAADHNAYHLGQLVLTRKLLGAWPDEG